MVTETLMQDGSAITFVLPGSTPRTYTLCGDRISLPSASQQEVDGRITTVPPYQAIFTSDSAYTTMTSFTVYESDGVTVFCTGTITVLGVKQ